MTNSSVFELFYSIYKYSQILKFPVKQIALFFSFFAQINLISSNREISSFMIGSVDFNCMLLH